jgi:hypothetical protein
MKLIDSEDPATLEDCTLFRLVQFKRSHSFASRGSAFSQVRRCTTVEHIAHEDVSRRLEKNLLSPFLTAYKLCKARKLERSEC